MTDIQFDLAGSRVNLRVAALISFQEKVLICRVPSEDWYFLPGGRIKTNESSLEAIKREIEEEIGKEFRILRPILIAENFFTLHTVDFHEICFFYAVEWTGQMKISKKHRDEFLEWIRRDDIHQIDLRPAFIKQAIYEIADELRLVIFRDKPSFSVHDKSGKNQR